MRSRTHPDRRGSEPRLVGGRCSTSGRAGGHQHRHLQPRGGRGERGHLLCHPGQHGAPDHGRARSRQGAWPHLASAYRPETAPHREPAPGRGDQPRRRGGSGRAGGPSRRRGGRGGRRAGRRQPGPARDRPGQRCGRAGADGGAGRRETALSVRTRDDRDMGPLGGMLPEGATSWGAWCWRDERRARRGLGATPEDAAGGLLVLSVVRAPARPPACCPGTSCWGQKEPVTSIDALWSVAASRRSATVTFWRNGGRASPCWVGWSVGTPAGAEGPPAPPRSLRGPPLDP